MGSPGDLHTDHMTIVNWMTRISNVLRQSLRSGNLKLLVQLDKHARHNGGNEPSQVQKIKQPEGS